MFPLTRPVAKMEFYAALAAAAVRRTATVVASVFARPHYELGVVCLETKHVLPEKGQQPELVEGFRDDDLQCVVRQFVDAHLVRIQVAFATQCSPGLWLSGFIVN